MANEHWAEIEFMMCFCNISVLYGALVRDGERTSQTFSPDFRLNQLSAWFSYSYFKHKHRDKIRTSWSLLLQINCVDSFSVLDCCLPLSDVFRTYSSFLVVAPEQPCLSSHLLLMNLHLTINTWRRFCQGYASTLSLQVSGHLQLKKDLSLWHFQHDLGYFRLVADGWMSLVCWIDFWHLVILKHGMQATWNT